MAIKINGATTITDSRRGVFKSVNPGAYTTANRPPGASEGDVIYDTDEKTILVWNGTEWISAGGGGIGGIGGLYFPPFSGVATLRVRLSNSEGKIVFSSDKINYQSSITVDIGDSFFVEWSDDIVNNAPHGSRYESTIKLEYLDLSIEEEFKVNISSVDKLPDPFTFTPIQDTVATNILEANKLAMLGSINAPTKLWGSSNSIDAEVNIAETGWQSIPTSIGTALRITSIDEIRTRHETLNGSLAQTTTTIQIGYGSEPGEYEEADFVTTNLESSIATPAITSPTAGSTGRLFEQLVTSSAFNGTGDANPHTSTTWEVYNDELLTNLVASSANDAVNLEQWEVSLPSDGNYYFRVKHIGSGGYESAYSSAVEVNCVTHYNWRVTVTMSAGGGSGGLWTGSGKTQGSSGGSGSFTLETLTAAVTAPDNLSWGIGSSGQVASNSGDRRNKAVGGSGYTRGGNGGYGSPDQGKMRSQSGAGGGSTGVRLNGSLLAGVGGGGGGGGGDGGNQGKGGNGASLPSAQGQTGQNHDSYSGGPGGSPSSSASNGEDAPEDGGSQAARGPGGGGFSGGRRDPDGSGWGQAGGGGGGGSWCRTTDGEVGLWRMYNVGGSGGNAITLYRATEGTTSFTQVGSLSMSGNGSSNIRDLIS